ncbi:hydroxyacylglutathione hydrolase [Blochmannia endosymbiont of Camponotus sp. C-046]|uniref:hydroxyacylglutathione hydrolase n=1 Tax=Blochmannia endosymbiont of Camponotus sp. C-046 TaxID=2945589 RepID=UPI002024BAB0|nr:hydroxyacylglutathione hydrolase [Blochmannia endosymbiont of Camponotus sp. C-046]URJ28498.1 hydroxyacylglutathione hydrolase [Blochmannia endosymbiont of Camponotus sp. C-046]
MNIIRVRVFNTNYIWFLYNYRGECIIVDPGEAVKVLNILKKLQFKLRAILLTHNHFDHINGVFSLTRYFPKTIVYGPMETKNNGAHCLVSEGDDFVLLQKKFKVINLTGHTLGHIGFYSAPWLFCGDTVFSAGCGKICVGFAQQMYESFLKIKHLPRNTLIFSGHEYTLSNINFAISILPRDQSIIDYCNKIIKLSKNNQPTVPTTVNLERKINPFFCCDNLDIKKSLNLPFNLKEEWQVFSALRNKKDSF